MSYRDIEELIETRGVHVELSIIQHDSERSDQAQHLTRFQQHKRQYLLKMEIEMDKYTCLSCDYVYDPAIGDPEGGVAPGTSFDDIPEDWTCPECGVGKDEFDLELNWR